jgi:hypothetical protein
MNEGTIICPQCGHAFELSDALTHQIREHLKTELQADLVKREAEAMLLWETKNAKGWSAQWIPKLKDDMIETRATIAILASVVLPEDVSRFGMVDGVWVSDPLSAIPLAAALRQQLVALDRERQSSVGKNEKMELLYHYLAGTEFKQKIEGIVEAFKPGLFARLRNAGTSRLKPRKESWIFGGIDSTRWPGTVQTLLSSMPTV